MSRPVPAEQRRFALETAARLRAAGYKAYFAGGCVRDELLGRTPKDFDVATDARPEQIRALFGTRRTLAIGAAFGVIAVIGGKESGNVEVTTFRRDAEYVDGRRPASVAFTDAEEDARRRDFTMNALFFDPATGEVIDFVGGRDDLRRRVVRAVGDAAQRIAEDKLRMLRGVRMAAVFGFELEAATRQAIVDSARQVTLVSPERIAQELRGMLNSAGRAEAARLLMELGLAAAVLPELVPLVALSNPATGTSYWNEALLTLERLGERAEPSFPLAWAALSADVGRPDAQGDVEAARRGAALVRQIGRRLRMSNEERDAAAWLVEHQHRLVGARNRPWSEVQPLLAHEWGGELTALAAARCAALRQSPLDVEFCLAKLTQPRAVLDPSPLVTGDDLVRLGLRPGREFAELLHAARAAQLDELIATPEAARELVLRLAGRLDDPPAET